MKKPKKKTHIMRVADNGMHLLIFLSIKDEIGRKCNAWAALQIFLKFSKRQAASLDDETIAAWMYGKTLASHLEQF